MFAVRSDCEHARAGRVDVDALEAHGMADAIAIRKTIDDHVGVDGERAELVDPRRRQRQFVRRRERGRAARDERENGQGAHGRFLVRAGTT